MKTIFTSVDHCVFDLSGVGLLMTTFGSVVSDYLLDICLICWLDLSRVENPFVSKSYDINWVWHSWLSLLSYWLRLFGWSISCLTVKGWSIFLDCDWGWLWCHWVECVWKNFGWKYVKSLGCSNVSFTWWTRPSKKGWLTIKALD